VTSLQENILNQYRSTFPNDKLKDYSSKTGIQITRIHRILNGAEMKLTEFEAFERAILGSDPVSEDFIKTAFSCLKSLNVKKINEYKRIMNHALKLEKMKELNIQPQLFELRLA
jgi:hypothetical protein